MVFKIIDVNDSVAWNAVLSKVEAYDFYHTSSYQRLDCAGTARLLVFEEGAECAAIPLIFRQIPHIDRRDVSSVYGYAGWVRTAGFYPEAVFPMLQDYFNEEKIVSAFSRLHPLIPGSAFFKLGEVSDLSVTLGMDLSLPEQMQWKAYSRSVRGSILRNKRSGERVIRAESEVGVQHFLKIYADAMTRLKAAPHYFFPESYFQALLNSPDFESFVLLAERHGEITGGALFVVCGAIMQYHLGAVANGSMSFSPLKLLLDEARRIAVEKKCSVFHLGGGHGGKDDSLFTFKSRMSTSSYPFQVWKWIVDEPYYEQLSRSKSSSSFFPAYRA